MAYNFITTDSSLFPKIPHNWSLKSGRYCFEENKCKNFDFAEQTLLQFTYGTIVKKKNQEITETDIEIYKKYTKVIPNDIMLNGLNLNYDFISQRIGIVKEKGIITSAYLSLRCHDVFNPMFANYLLKSLDEQKIFHGMGSGVRLTLGFSEFSRIQLPVPPRSEQDHIVRYLDYKTARIDKLISGYKRQIELLEERKLTFINDSITGKNCECECVESGVNWIGKVPAHWNIDKVKQHFKILKRIAGKEGYEVISITQQGLKIKDISTNEGQMAASYANYQFIYPGEYAMNHMDLLTGYMGLSDMLGVTSPDYRVFALTDTENCDPNYYLYVFQLGYKRKIFYGLGKGAANKGRWRMPAMNFKNYDIPVPPIEEQKKIVDKIRKYEDKIDFAIQKVNEQIALLQEYRTRLISDVVTGQVDVRDEVIPETEVNDIGN